jgi:hypothetical protein
MYVGRVYMSLPAEPDQRFCSSATATALQEPVKQPDVDGAKPIDNTIVVHG